MSFVFPLETFVSKSLNTSKLTQEILLLEMEYTSPIYVFSVTFLTVCSAEYTADEVYEFLTNRLDNVFFDIRNMRRDIGKLSDQIELTSPTVEFTHSKKNVDDMFETFRTEINDIRAATENLEGSVLKKLDDIIEEKLASRFNDKQVETLEKSTRVEIKKYLKSLSAEKLFIRKMTNEFENRVNGVEQKMFSFENASWKGEKGSQGVPGMSGLTGSKGERGLNVKGQKGDKGDIGNIGATGRTGNSGEKGERGLTGSTGAKGQTGEKGSRQTEYDVFFTATLTKTLSDVDPKKIIVFDRVDSQGGNAYSSSTGKFTAPVSGTYLFHFSVETANLGKIAHVYLILDETRVSSALVETKHDGHDASSSNAAVLYVKKGQSVWIQTARFDHKHEIYGWRTTFSGVLLRAR